MNFIKKLLLDTFTRVKEPNTPNQAIGKFLRKLQEGRVQLEILHKGQLTLLVESLTYVPSWFKGTNKDTKFYRDGYVLSCAYDNEYFETSYAIKAFKNIQTKGEYILMDNFLHENSIKIIVYFLPKVEPIQLALAMKRFIETFNNFEESNPQMDFNLRYLSNVPG